MPTPGTEVFSDHLSLHAGGGAFITAATLAAYGYEVSQFSVFPASPFAQTVQDELLRHNVCSGYCTPAAPNADPQISVAIANDGDRAFLTRLAGPALPETTPQTFSGFAHMHIGELKTLEDNPSLLAHARSAGLTISLDCSWQDEFDPAVVDLIAAVDVFLPSFREQEALLAVGVPENCAALTVVKCGEHGARACQRSSSDWVISDTVPATVVDATGAGDAFNGGFLSEWLKSASLEQCLASANLAGRAAIRAIGGAESLLTTSIAENASGAR